MDAGVIPRVLVRIVTKPIEARDELLVLYVESRTLKDPEVLVYSATADAWRSEPHRRLMLRTRRASPTERALAQEALVHIGETVHILAAAPPLLRDSCADADADEAPVTRDEDGYETVHNVRAAGRPVR